MCVSVFVSLCTHMYALLFHSENTVASHGLFEGYECVCHCKGQSFAIMIFTSWMCITFAQQPPAIYQWLGYGMAGLHLP